MELYSHQKKAIEELHNGCILVAGVGTGKSLTALGYFLTKVWALDKSTPLYIITTAMKRDSSEWEADALKIGIGVDKDISLVVDSWNNIGKYLGVSDAFFIFDEQRAVGKGQWARTFVKIARRNKWIMLTATPGDTWMDYIPVFLANNFYRYRKDFLERHVVFSPYTKYPKVQRYTDVDELVRLRDSITVTMFYRKPTEAHEITKIFPYDEKAYKEITDTRWDFDKDAPIENYSQLCSKWRSISNASEERYLEVLRIMQEHPRIIVFYNFDYELEGLRELLSINNITFAERNGHKHEEVPKGERWAYLVQYASGSEAWNCIETDCIIFFSLNYSYKMMKQSMGRIDRLNTSYTDLYYYRFRSDSKIDKAIERCLNRKQNFNEKMYCEKGKLL
jgi:superfamily II DNA or RNA helicase